MRRTQNYSVPGLTVTFDPDVCIHSATCLKVLPAVFDVSRKRWIRPEAASPDDVVAAIRQCPSGALGYRLEAEAGPVEVVDEQVEKSVIIRASLNGPLLVEGSFELVDENGAIVSTTGRAALCRCGASRMRPFCDGSHRKLV